MELSTTLLLSCVAGLSIAACYDILTKQSGKSKTKAPAASSSASASTKDQEHPPSNWEAKCHHLEPEVSESIHKYFLKGWKFRTDKVREKFPSQGLATWHCYAFPESKDDRIEAGARLSVILFLVDGKSLEKPSARPPRLLTS